MSCVIFTYEVICEKPATLGIPGLPADTKNSGSHSWIVLGLVRTLEFEDQYFRRTFFTLFNRRKIRRKLHSGNTGIQIQATTQKL